MPHPVVYRDNLDDLMAEWKRTDTKKIGNGQCVRLPQEYTNVGHTSRWQRGARVLDLTTLPPGTVIANFKLVNNKWRFPNEKGWHAALFYGFAEVEKDPKGKPTAIVMVDQWTNKAPGMRRVSSWTAAEKKANPKRAEASNEATEFYVVEVQ
ncbi:BPSL0067 family protein [Massilia sp. CCM 8734]|uniref:BPSL0067 family protein n=1 Tax=Massilia sp. CCM 8734 TaxID=2609283 RepID=UPI001421D001|nr:BPSL0067 family protein [Massilia sp. CCM 8734]NHZ94296.1 BPSL0067 family protein [Massilia sp. CCM 8734]